MSNPAAGKTQFKRDMGTDSIYRFGGRKWTPTECSALVLGEMKRIAEMHLGSNIESAVITVPGYFRDEQRNATLDAARIAGFTEQRIINEPTAAALAYGYQNPDTESSLLVFDLGGGTFDVTIMDVFDGVIEVKASGGVSHLGGEDYTDALLNWIQEKYNWKPKSEDERRWRQHIEMVKRRLTKQEKAMVSLGEREVEVSRADYAKATLKLTEKIFPVISRCMSDAGAELSELDDVLLIGGATRDQNLNDHLIEKLKRIPNRKLDPDQVVAMGAAIQAALCLEDSAVDDIVLTDVSPHTLGVEVGRKLSNGITKEGFFSPIIDRNTTVPVSRRDVFETFHPDQDIIHLRVFQGESRMVEGNRLIGEINIKGLKQRNSKQKYGQAEVCFSYDMNGILEVEVTILHSGLKINKVIEERPGSLTEEQIQETIRKFAPLKIHPRDKIEHRARIERSNRLYIELIGTQRDELSYRLESFEDALESQNVEKINIASHLLDGFLEPFFTFDGEYDGDVKW